jgi:probable rRNA maturation factor
MGEAVEILLSIEERGWHEAAPEGMSVESLVEGAVRAALLQAAPRLRHGEVSIVLASDARVRELNRDWRGQDKPTNVLSFPGGDPDDFEDDDEEEDDDDSEEEEEEEDDGDAPPPLQLGDVILAWPTVAREARDQGKKVEAHLSHLVVHGLLHLLGYDHEAEEEADEMERLEASILLGLGIADPYHEAGAPLADEPRRP